jgi:hypothetical protein
MKNLLIALLPGISFVMTGYLPANTTYESARMLPPFPCLLD